MTKSWLKDVRLILSGGYWTFGVFALFFVVYSLVIVGRAHARSLGENPLRVYNMCGVLTIGVSFFYANSSPLFKHLP